MSTGPLKPLWVCRVCRPDEKNNVQASIAVPRDVSKDKVVESLPHFVARGVAEAPPPFIHAALNNNFSITLDEHHVKNGNAILISN
jgi:hypothetical protein